MNTKIQMSAELLDRWSADAIASRDAADLLTLTALEVSLDGENANVEAIRTLIHAARYAGIQLSVFASLMESEARIALKTGEPR